MQVPLTNVELTRADCMQPAPVEETLIHLFHGIVDGEPSTSDEAAGLFSLVGAYLRDDYWAEILNDYLLGQLTKRVQS